MKRNKSKVKQKKCYYCKNLINKDINQCPYCNRKQSIHHIIVFSLISIFLGLLVFILIVGNDVFTYNINSVVVINNVEYKITSIDRVLEESSWMGTPKEGSEFLLISLLVKNNNISEFNYKKEYWSLKEKDGTIIKSNSYDIDLDSIINSKIDNRKSVVKVLIFEVPINTNDYYLSFEDNEKLSNKFQIKLF